MEVPIELYKWLVDSGAITEYDIKEKQAKKIVLEQEATQLFEIGLKLPPLLNRLQALKSLKDPETNIPLPGFDSLKDSLTPAAKLYNWNVVTKALDIYGVKLEDDVKSLIIAGDLQMIVDTLQRIHEVELDMISRSEAARLSAEAQNRARASLQHQPTGARGKAKANDKRKGAVDIATLNVDKQPEEIESCLEFLLVTLSRSFGLKPKQVLLKTELFSAAGLLTDSNKYLSHILVKGLKGDFGPVTGWLMQVYAWSKNFSTLIKGEEESNSVHMVLNAFKGGLYSKSRDVATWTGKVVGKLAYDFLSLGLEKQAWEWFVSVDGGLDGTVHFLQRHSGMETIALELFENIGKGHLNELFTHYHKNAVKDNLQYWRMVLSFIAPLAALLSKQDTEDKQALESVVQFWLDCSCREADNDGRHTPDERTTALNILAELWMSFPSFVEAKEEVANHVLTMLKRASRDKSMAVQVFALARLFRLLETFAVRKNAYAPVIYKALTFSLVENHQSLALREFIMKSLSALYQLQPSIPVGIVVDPLVKQIQLSENTTYFYNMFDFEFFGTVADNPKLGAKTGIQLLDVLAKVMLSEPLYTGLAKAPFLRIAQRLLSNPGVQDFLSKFVKIALSTVLGQVKKKLTPSKAKAAKKPRYPNYQALLQAQAQEQHEEKTGEVLCKLSIETLLDVQALGDDSLNEQIKTLALTTHLKIKQISKADYPALHPLLALYGEPEELIAGFEAENAKGYPQLQYPQGVPLAIEAPPQLGSQQRKTRVPGRGASIEPGNRSALADQDLSEEVRRAKDDTQPPADGGGSNKYQLVPYFASKAEREINQKAMLDIERIKKSKQQRDALKKDKEQMKKVKVEREKRSLKQQLERRKIELGVATRVFP